MDVFAGGHEKLRGGSWRTAAHDLAKIRDARKAVSDANREMTERAARRRNRAYSSTYADMSPYIAYRPEAL